MANALKDTKSGMVKRAIVCGLCAVALGFPILVGAVSCSSMPERWWVEDMAESYEGFTGGEDFGAVLVEKASLFPSQVPEMLDSEAVLEISPQGRLNFNFHNAADVFQKPLSPLFDSSWINGNLSLDFESSSFTFSNGGNNATGTFEYRNGEEAIEHLGQKGLNRGFLNVVAWRAASGSGKAAIALLSLTPDEVETILPSCAELLTEPGQALDLVFFLRDDYLQVYAPQWNEFANYETE